MRRLFCALLFLGLVTRALVDAVALHTDPDPGGPHNGG